MSKVLPYIVIAILLGTVTMVVPYALLGSSDYTPMTEGNTLIQPSPEQPSAPPESSTPMPTPEPVPSSVPSAVPSAIPSTVPSHNPETSSSDSLTPPLSALPESPTPIPSPATMEPIPRPAPTPSPIPSPTPETSEPKPSEPAGAETEAPLAPQPALGGTDLITESLSHLPAIGLMIVPSFLIALGAFVYLKKRRP
jgi:hypothetical protein